jgi:hypothetical protein
MIDKDQSTIIEAPEVYKSIPTHSPTATPTTECTREKNVDFDLFDGHVMVNYIEPNLQDIIFGHKSRFDHSETILGPFKKLPFLRLDPLLAVDGGTRIQGMDPWRSDFWLQGAA